jgi:hypothetical protein
VQDSCEVLEHPKCHVKDDLDSALFGGSLQNREGIKELLLTALEDKQAVLVTPSPARPVAQSFHLVVVRQLLFPLGRHFIERETVADVPQGSSPQDEQQIQRIGQAKFDLIVDDLSDGRPDETVETKRQGQPVPFRKALSIEHTRESAPV